MRSANMLKPPVEKFKIAIPYDPPQQTCSKHVKAPARQVASWFERIKTVGQGPIRTKLRSVLVGLSLSRWPQFRLNGPHFLKKSALRGCTGASRKNLSSLRALPNLRNFALERQTYKTSQSPIASARAQSPQPRRPRMDFCRRFCWRF